MVNYTILCSDLSIKLFLKVQLMKFQLNGERDTKALAKDAWEVQCLDQDMELMCIDINQN